MHTRHALRLVAAAFATVAALGAIFGPAHAQTYPTKSITLVVPLAAGTGMDTIARLYAEQLSHTLGKPIVIDNRPGADRKSTRLNSSHLGISYAVFCLKK